MEAGRWRGGGTFVARVDGLVAALRLWRGTDVGWERHPAAALQQAGHVGAGDDPVPVTEALQQPQLIPAGGEHQIWPEAFARSRQDFPRAVQIRPQVSEEEQLHQAAGRLSGWSLAGSTFVSFRTSASPGRRKFGRSRTVGTAHHVNHHQAGGVARFGGSLSDQVFGKLVVELGDEHPSGGRRG